MNSLPIHIIFANIKQLPKQYLTTVLVAYELELESRIPEPYLEYDQDGNVIINEVIGFTDEGEEIWV